MMKTDTILINGTVLTMDDALPRVEAISIRGNQITAVGATGEIERLASTDTDRIDLGGKTVIPGFIDAHVHFLNMGLKLMEVNLRGADSIAEALERMRQRGREVGRGAWVVGNRWDESKWVERRYLTRSDLDRALPDNPAVARRICEHLWVANSKVLALAAIPTDQPGFDAAAGTLRWGAKDYLRSFLQPDAQGYSEAIRLAVNEALRLGVTSVHEWFPKFPVFHEALAANRLPIKIYGGPDVGALESIQALQLPTGFGASYLKLGPIKLFADGSVGARTAALLHPYEDEPGHLGQLVWETEALHRVIASAHNAGLQIAVHALGDRGITATVDAFEAAFTANPRLNHRHRIEHCELLTPTLMERIADLGLVVSAQPNFVGEWGFPDGLYETRLGWERVSRMNPFGELARRGIPMAFGSDCMPFHPLYGIWSAVAHPIPEYRLTPYEALRHYTQSAAYTAFEEEIKGTIKPGMVADLAVLSADATAIDVDGIREIEVEMTMIDGKVWYVKRDA